MGQKDFFYYIAFIDDGGSPSHNPVLNRIPGEKTCKEKGQVGLVGHRSLDADHLGKNEPVNNEKEDRVKKIPEKPEIRTGIAFFDVTGDNMKSKR